MQTGTRWTACWSPPTRLDARQCERDTLQDRYRPVRALIIFAIALGLCVACEKNGTSTGPTSPAKGSAQPAKGGSAPEKADESAPDDEQIVPPPDKPGYAPLD